MAKIGNALDLTIRLQNPVVQPELRYQALIWLVDTVL